MAKLLKSTHDARKVVTIRDIAKKTGISVATVGRAIGGYGRISEATRQMVFAAVRELDYRPNMFAQSLKGKSTKTIGLMIANVINPFFSMVVRAVEDTAIGNGFNVIVCNIDEDHEKECSYLELLRSKRVDGLLVCSSFSDIKEMRRKTIRIYEQDIPTVFIDRQIQNIACPCVQTDSFGGSVLAINHLIGLGHKRIGLLCHTPNVDTIRNRTQGYIKAHADAGLKCDPSLMISRNDSRSADGLDMAMSLLKRKDRPTALLTTNCLVAFGALTAIKKLGMRIPEDVAFITWDDFDLAEAMTPAVTVVTQPTYSLGNIGASKLFDMIKGRSNRESIVLSPQLVVRESCGVKLGKREF
jgi:LacI family transcriptional regulator